MAGCQSVLPLAKCNQVQRTAFKPAGGVAFEGTRIAPFL
jgi:hypothetical protein